jgi:rSAM/selenodomain-associated transferase 1
MDTPWQVAILARAAVPGAAKTRLVPRIGVERAAALQAHLTELALQRVRDAGAACRLWIAGPIDSATCRLAASYGAELRVQPGGDLGDRMLAALLDAQARGLRGLVIGTDCPAQRPEHLVEACQLLGTHDAVLQPALDGGYVLIGAVALHADLFRDIRWGSDTVLAATRARCAALGWRCAELQALPDLDRPEDMDLALSRGWIDATAFA